jgi:hypothetical protein
VDEGGEGVRLLLLSDAPSLPTSYANVVRHFAHAVAERGVAVAFGSLQHSGLPLKYEHRGRTYPLYGCLPPHRITDAVRDFDPDLIVHVRDFVVHIPRMFPQGNYSVRAQAVNGAPTWGWVPVQHEVSPWDYVDALHREYSVVMPFTRTGGDALGDSGLVRDRIEPLQLGVSDAYSDPEGPAAIGYGRDGVPMVMSVGLGHQDRKAFPLLMRAFREARRADPSLDLEFYLHTSPLAAYDLVEHTRMMGVDGRWLFPRGYDPGIGYPEEDLAARYRRAGAYASVGTGEGWDMPLSEACALGRAVVFPADANRLEVTADYGGPKLPVSTFPFPRQMNWERMMDVQHLAEQLLRLRGLEPDPAAGREYFARHNWGTVADRFLEIARGRGIP